MKKFVAPFIKISGRFFPKLINRVVFLKTPFLVKLGLKIYKQPWADYFKEEICLFSQQNNYPKSFKAEMKSKVFYNQRFLFKSINLLISNDKLIFTITLKLY